MSTMVEPQAPRLVASDRCDACGVSDNGQGISQAKVRVQLETGSLYFCGHCFLVHETPLRKKALDVIDQRGSHE